MTEEQKTHGALYKPKKAKTSVATDNPTGPRAATTADSSKMAHAAYVEDVNDDFGDWRDYEDKSDDDDQSAGDLPPEAPTPPPAAEGPVNVFDFLVANATPTASSLSLPQPGRVQLSEDTQLVRFDHEANGILDAFGDMDDDAMVQYGTGPVPTSFETPAPKGERKKIKESDKDRKTDKKRKRLHIETDQIMTDAPPVLHSGLTGGLNKLMTRPHAFPPSPDYSGGDMADTPASPLKKTKHSKHGKVSRTETIGNSIMAMISSGTTKPTKVKSKKRKSSTANGTTSTKKHHRHRLEAPKEQKLLEYTPGKDGEAVNGNQMVLYKPRAETFLSFVTKGPESERGCSLNKALKRYHRERNASGHSLGKMLEEKELFRSLRLRKNERGEIVLFTV
jgi:cell growth-regulating nucleolar protein